MSMYSQSSVHNTQGPYQAGPMERACTKQLTFYISRSVAFPLCIHSHIPVRLMNIVSLIVLARTLHRTLQPFRKEVDEQEMT